MQEGRLDFQFPSGFQVEKYDGLNFYKKQVQNSFGATHKGVDFLAFDPSADRLWILEVKDFRIGQRDKDEDLSEAIPLKVRDTLLGLTLAGHHHDAETARIQNFLSAKEIRVVFHCEQPAHPSKLFPGASLPANFKTQLSQRLRLVDPHPTVVSIQDPKSVPWTVTSVPAGTPSAVTGSATRRHT
ncbi:MAG: hypothetical protein IPN71_18905 [Fibrobacteres bacterium]|nr:hypothetical protein [Fibrobacterota bacterium]